MKVAAYILVVVCCMSEWVQADKVMLFDGIQKCTNSSVKDAITVTHNWADGKFSGSINVPMSVSTALKYEAVIYKLVDGNWKQISTLKGTVCSLMEKILKSAWEKIAEASNVAKKCPIGKGTYELKDFTISAADAKIPYMKGEFLVRAQALVAGTTIICREIKMKSAE